MKRTFRPYAHNQASSSGLGNQTTTTGSVSSLPFILASKDINLTTALENM